MNDITKNEVKEKQEEQLIRGLQLLCETAGLDFNNYTLQKVKSQPKPAPNIQLFQTAAYLAATTLSPAANKVLMYFLSVSEFENFVGIDQKTLKEEMGVSLSSIERGIRELEKNGIIYKSKHLSDKRRNDYFLNPLTAWKGKILNRKIALEKLSKEPDNQLHMFGEQYDSSIAREQAEIRQKKPMYSLLGGAKEENRIDENPYDLEDCLELTSD